MRAARLLVVVVLASCATIPAAQPLSRGDEQALQARTEALVHEARVRAGTPGVGVVIVDGARTVLRRGYGLADVASGRAVDEHTVFRVGSVSKLVTALLAMQLVEEGKLSLDDEVRKHLPELDLASRFPDAPPMTVRDLLTHHAGLPANRIKGLLSQHAPAYDDYVQLLRGEHVVAPPRTALVYSNLGYTLLGVVVERAAGVPYPTLAQTRVLKPAGMLDATFLPSEVPAGRQATGYRDGAPLAEGTLGVLPAGGLHASVADLGAFMRMLLADGRGDAGVVVKPETLQAMLHAQNDEVALDFDMHMGLGFFLDDDEALGGRRVPWHAGDTLLYHTQLLILPEEKLGVAVVTNSAEGGNFVRDVARDILKSTLEVQRGEETPSYAALPPVDETAFSDAELDALQGHYALEFGHFHLRRAGKHLRTRAFGTDFELVPTKNRTFRAQALLLGFIPYVPEYFATRELEFVRVEDTDAVLVKRNGKRALAGTKFTPQPLPPSWRARQGVFHPVDAAGDTVAIDAIELREEDGVLVATVQSNFMSIPVTRALVPIDDDTAITAGLGTGLGDTVRAVDGDASSFSVVGYRFERSAP